MAFRLLSIALFAFLGMACPVNAQLITITFDIPVAGGTLSGEILNLDNNGLPSTPTDIIITQQPSGYYYGAGDLEIGQPGGFQFYGADDTFTVSGGQVVAADLAVYKLIGTSDYQAYGFGVTVGTETNANGIYQSIGGVVTDNYNNTGVVQDTYVPAPEPHWTAALFILAGVALIFARKIRTRFSRSAPVS